MRLHSLRLAAVGPFPGEHTIDFAALGAGGLFLLEGPTGAGKSTVIDAIVFALYGRPAATGASPDRLPSLHAAPGSTPEVDLIFETSAGVFRIQRSPEHTRPKRRGHGVTTEQACVRLWRLTDTSDPVGSVLSTRVGEADEEIRRIIGLSREQLVQTIVLPQGEFAAFLRSSPEDRRAVLQRIFGTEVYQRMQDHLVEAARTARRQTQAARAEVRTAIDAFVRTARAAMPAGAGPADPLAPAGAALLLAGRLDHLSEMAADPEESKTTAVIDDVLESLAVDVAARVGTEAAAREQESVARLALDAARRTTDLLTRRAALERERSRLSAQAADIRATAAGLETARRADGVLGAVHAAAAAHRTLRAAESDVSAISADVGRGRHADLLDAGISALSEARGAALGESGALDALVATERTFADRVQAQQADRDAVEHLRGRLATAVADLQRRPEERAVLESEVAALRTVAGGASLLEHERDAIARSLEAARTAEALRPRVRAALERAERALAEAAGAVAREAELRRRRLAGIAGELAADLGPDVPCPVCGSPEHPSPAGRGPDAVSEVEIDEAEARRALAEQAAHTAGREAAELDARHAAQQDRAGGLVSTEWADRLREAEAGLREARSASSAVGAREARISAFDRHTEALRTQRVDLERSVSGAESALVSAESALARDREAVSRARGDAPSVEARAASLTARAQAAELLANALRAHRTARSAWEDQSRLLHAALAEAGFGSAADAEAAALDRPTVEAAQARIAAHRSACDRVEAGLAEPEMAELPRDEAPDVARLERRHATADTAFVAATREAERARTHLAAVRASGEEVARCLAADAAVSLAAEPVLRVADLASAGEGNERRTTLATYVVLRRFEDVVAAANTRLTAMSAGRYALARTDDREGGSAARRTGLGLVVEDHLTGARRNPRTLSGGETFYVSLCLALGLADVVTAEAGGLDLGTLIIDEGFGSLDPETLDDVLAELGHLRAGGRVVGIVSHVAELKQRVPERIEVRRRPDGASTLRVIA